MNSGQALYQLSGIDVTELKHHIDSRPSQPATAPAATVFMFRLKTIVSTAGFEVMNPFPIPVTFLPPIVSGMTTEVSSP